MLNFRELLEDGNDFELLVRELLYNYDLKARQRAYEIGMERISLWQKEVYID